MRRVAESRDREAFVLLFERYASRVKGFMINGGAAHDEADEAAQDVLVSVWRHAARYDPAKAAVSTWIFAIARNRRIDVLRRRARPVPDPEDPLFRPDPEPGPAAAAVAADRAARMRAALDSLGPDQREAVRLAFYLGLSQSEIAARAGLPLGTVKSHIRRGLMLMREHLATP